MIPSPWVGPIVALTPSRVETWHGCRRQFRMKYLLPLPASDPAPAGTSAGLETHALLQALHEAGGCGDDAVLDRLGADFSPVARDYARRHPPTCPGAHGAVAVGHELELVRAQTHTMPGFIVTGRLDAVWADTDTGVLLGVDYKTGALRQTEVGDSVAARMYAWLLAPLAARDGLQVCIAHEYLSPRVPNDPTPFMPDAAGLAAIGDELADVAASIHAERSFAGVAAPDPCGVCDFRRICPDAVVD